MKQTVLAVDDNVVHCYTIVKILKRAGYNVLRAGTGMQALTMAFLHLPDAVLLDLNLPDVSGFEVCSRIKANEGTRHIPIIFHTATNGTGAAKSHAEMIGASAFLTYPIRSEHLLTVLTGALAKSSHGVKPPGESTAS